MLITHLASYYLVFSQHTWRKVQWTYINDDSGNEVVLNSKFRTVSNFNNCMKEKRDEMRSNQIVLRNYMKNIVKGASALNIYTFVSRIVEYSI